MTESNVSERASHRFPDHCSTLLRRLHELRRRDILCDVTVSVEGRNFRCHKAILAVCSGYFRSLFAANNNNTSIALPGVNANVVEDILNYMYTGELQLDTQHMTAYLDVASYLEIPAVVELCDAVYKNTASHTSPEDVMMRSSDRNLFTAFGAKAPMWQSDRERNGKEDFTWNFVNTSEGQIAILKDVEEGGNEKKIDDKQSNGIILRPEENSSVIMQSQGSPQEGTTSSEMFAKTDGKDPAKGKLGKRKTLKKFKLKELKVKLVPLYSVRKKKTQDGGAEREEHQRKESDSSSASCSLETVEISKWVDPENMCDDQSGDFWSSVGNQSDDDRLINRQAEEQCALNSVGEVSTHSTSEDSSREQDCGALGGEADAKPRLLKIDVASLTGGGKRRIKREPSTTMAFLSSPGGQFDGNASTSSSSNSSPEPTVSDPLGKRRTCRICLITLRDQEEKSLHLHTVHFDRFTNKWQCPYCDNSYTASNNLQKHCVKEHGLPPGAPKGERCRCLICHARFDSQEEKTRHLHAEHFNQQVQKWECPFCSHSYTANNNLKKHCNKVHYKLCLVECPVCGKELKDKQRLKEHMYSHTGEKPYVCTTCSKRFTCHTGLKRHLLLHTGERPFCCSVCDSSFRQKRHLKEHMLRHSDAKPYRCETCGQQFRHSTAYRNHRYQHTSQRPWLCKLCGAGFIKKINIRRHLATKHGIEDKEDKGQGSDGTGQAGSDGIGQVGLEGIGQGSEELTNNDAAVLSMGGGDLPGLDPGGVAMVTKGGVTMATPGEKIVTGETIEQVEDVDGEVGMGQEIAEEKKSMFPVVGPSVENMFEAINPWGK
ncbi:ZBTB17 [Branchiostoma lanceolatum]|uniref:ZBTB17 protein n=1 Tax=Branchiostoma lanceolatum TaxID=7740 RepID=A0A8J9ZRJ4_BRALA|nr:ZBTB17 [Branchiostoma lanceolatum]